MDSAFKVWIGQPVVLQVALGEIKVPLRGRLLKDGDETVRAVMGSVSVPPWRGRAGWWSFRGNRSVLVRSAKDRGVSRAPHAGLLSRVQ